HAIGQGLQRAVVAGSLCGRVLAYRPGSLHGGGRRHAVTFVSELVIAGALGLWLYAYVCYPAILKLLSVTRRMPRAGQPREWPFVSITMPVHNAASVIADTLEHVLALDYPAERRQIVVVSDASTDGTDAIVRQFADRGVELVRIPERR